MYRLLILPFFCLLSLGLIAQPQVPTQLEYCGTTLYLNPAARAQIATYVGQIHQSPRYFQEMVQRARLYMPYIEQAFAEAQVPQDLKYLAIQESGLRPSVVSSSQAVGFWQFKAGAASDMGLEVSGKIDERRHIYRASQAAADYLSVGNRDFNNWVYAVIAYYEGPTGAIKHTDPTYYGEKKMQVTENLHWYVMKAIAHKVAYEAALAAPPVAPLYLRAHHQGSPIQLNELLRRHELQREEFIEYNQWLLHPQQLARMESFVYFTPTMEPATPYMAQEEVLPPTPSPLISDLAEESPAEEPPASSPPPSKYLPAEPEPLPTPVATSPYSSYTATQTLPDNPNHYVLFPLAQDLHVGQQYVLYDGSKRMIQISETYGKLLSRLLIWNGLLPGEEPPLGRMLYLNKASKREFHIVRPGESLESIAALHLRSVRTLQKKNRMRKADLHLFVGQKLYLKSKRPKGEKLIILSVENVGQTEPQPSAELPAVPLSTPSAQVNPEPGPTEPATASVLPAPRPREVTTPLLPAAEQSSGSQVKEVKTRWITHVVSTGETLWEISQRYGTKVEIIKMINKLESDNISEGQQLRILAKEDLLQSSTKSGSTVGVGRH